MPLPNLCHLQQQQPTGRLANATEWVFVQRLKKGRPHPNRDPITTEDWRAHVRKREGDGPAPENGWMLEVNTGDGKRTPEPGYLYDIEALAQHLINGGTSPISRLPAHRDDARECIDAANAIRRAKGLPNLERMTPRAEPLGELPPLPRVSRAAAREAGRNVPAREEQLRWLQQAAGAEPPEWMPRHGPMSQRRRELRSRWSGNVYPPLSDGVQSEYEEWYRALPEGATASFLRNADMVYQIPRLVFDEAALSRSMTHLLTMLDRLLQEAPAQQGTNLRGLYAMAGAGRSAWMGNDPGGPTDWMNTLWQVIGVWKRQARRRRAWAAARAAGREHPQWLHLD